MLLNNSSEYLERTETEASDEECQEIWWLEELRIGYSAVHGYSGLLVCLLGLLCNLLNVAVLTRRHMLSSTNVLLCALAVANATKMFSFVPLYAHFYLSPSDLPLFYSYSSAWVYYLLVQITLGIMLHAVALYITISIAIFRYLYIRFPITGVRLCSVHNSVLVILCMTALATLISVPNILSNDIVQHSHPTSENDTVYSIMPSEVDLVQSLNMWVQSIFIRFLPCFALTVFTCLLIVEIRKAKVRRCTLKNATIMALRIDGDHHRKRKETDATTTMLLVVVVLFLAVEFPQGVMAVANSVSSCFYGKVYMAVGDLLDLITLSNNAVNFVIYTSMSKQFRKSFVRLFCSCTGRCCSRKCSNQNPRTFHADASAFQREELTVVRATEHQCFTR